MSKRAEGEEASRFISRILERYNPAVDRRYLILTVGLVWGIVGIGLCAMAFHWLTSVPIVRTTELGLAGLILAVLIGTFGFSRLVRQNLERIRSKPGKACLFSFQPWRSYLIIGVMVTFGALLRQSAIPKPYLAVVYFAMGGAMVLASRVYFRAFLGRSAVN